jgi:DNA modification methylase
MSQRREDLAGGRVVLLPGDCSSLLATLEPNSIDSIVTDPPAGISFMGREWDHNKGGRDHWIAWMQEIAAEGLRVAKPGAHALVWALPRTSHWTATAWENAGWSVRDRVAHMFGTGFPKSLNVSAAIDKLRRRDFVHAALEMGIPLPSRSVDDWTKEDHAPGDKWWIEFKSGLPVETWKAIERHIVGTSRSGTTSWFGSGEGHITAPATDAARQWAGWGTSLKPAMEDWWLLRKPLSEKTVAANVLKWSTGALHVDACRIPTVDKLGGGGEKAETAGKFTNEGWRRPWMDDPEASQAFAAKVRANVEKAEAIGRFPANCIHDGSEEVEAAFAAFGERQSGNYPANRSKSFWRDQSPEKLEHRSTEAGSASRFFFSAKADQDSRLGSSHPTVKPLSLIQYLVRLITPKGGTCLDLFAGTGTTGEACIREGMRAVLIEREEEYQQDIRRRMALALAGPDERRHATIKAKNKVEDAGPLFAGGGL